MKKFLCIALCVMVLSACNSTSVGVIGGSDGPTSIIIGEESDNVKRLRIVDGADSGKLILAGETPNDVYFLNATDVDIILYGEKSENVKLEDGMPVDIYFDGSIEETFPARLGGVKNIVAYKRGTEQNPKGEYYDLSGLYLKVLEDLWEIDSGLNSDIKYVSVDLSDAPGDLTEGEKAAIMYIFSTKHNAEGLSLNYEQLADKGYINKDELYWEDGVLFTISHSKKAEIFNGLVVKFDAQKWRSGLGAYFFFDCSASWSQDGTWEDYSIGGQAIS